ncbi:class 1 isoprenoid biosynthesis enzyme [Cetobacterium sp.]|uniref:class 1 isoprenoid biosynthesis enzyme n=2 Tax=Cetobacterium sp. TaxID=2071632 RepID=UPI0025C5EBE6|nr:class 1 isoprenoid biosynthesis enzyme [Cetobacterium sp.]
MKNHILLGKLLMNAFKILGKAQNEIENDLKNFKFTKELEIDFKNINFKESFRKNFFTLLIISILLESKVSKKHIVSYSKIITYLRQIVTSTDNIIDNENKGLIFIKNLKNKTVSNSLIMLTCQNLLTKECLELNEGKDLAVKKIFDKIYLIALSESLRDKAQYLEYPTEKYILEKIHSGIGGELLKISLEAPLAIEENIKLKEYSNGIFEIGMALQALDDFFDIEEDEESGKINLLKSALLYSEKGEEVVREEYLKKVSENAYNGFKILEDNEFPINKKEAKKVLKKLFELRGLKEYVSILD